MGRRRSLIASAALALAVLTGCGTADGLDIADGRPAGGKAAEAATGTSPLANPDGTRPGLAAITSADERAEARALIERLRTKGRGPKTGYEREKFGYAWADSVDGIPFGRNGCDTRNDVLKRDGQRLQFRSGSDCVVISMTLFDPYTGKTIEWTKQNAAEVQIDHVVPLSYSWQMGASRWSDEKRRQLANDPLNLMPVDGATNSRKGDSGPASWLPPRREIRCAYVVRFAQVALKYDLPVTTADKETMLQQCS
ncbi:lipoprotein [Thermobispora bispora]|uniref:HNH endonuclease family protein n=1 Tax=Thermobispora bispora TaxID=2006 RepID=UPI0030E941EB